MKQLASMMPDKIRLTLIMRAFGLAKVPLLFMASPRVLQIDARKIEVLIPFRKIVKNHVGSMYFGALAIGADTAVGLLAMDKIFRSGKKATLLFKDFHADFLKRAEGDTTFVCEEGDKIDELLEKVFDTGERVNAPIACKAFAKGEEVAHFTLTLSIKAK